MKEEIKSFFQGEVLDDAETLEKYSRDASLFQVWPKLIVYPKDKKDLENLVQFVTEKKNSDPSISLTPRAAGSDMTGGPLNESIIADVTKHLNRINEIENRQIVVEPGVFYRDFEKKTLEQGLILPCYTASKDMNALGGMYGNNSAGERTLRHGQMEKFVLESKVIFSDGVERVVKPLKKSELEEKFKQQDLEGEIYREVYKLVTENKKILEEARPKVSKNSAGYYLWNVFDGETFDLNKLLVGSQGTLGLTTEMKLRLERIKPRHDLVALFFDSWEKMPEVVNAILPLEPESLETFDEDTLKLGLHFMPEIAKLAGQSLFSFALKFWPEALIGLKMLGLPKLIILVEVSEETEEKVKERVRQIVERVEAFDINYRVIEKESEEEKFWIMRRESFNLLRKHVSGKRTAPFVEDFCIKPESVPSFLPEALKILKEAGIEANIAGHAGNGNFHIIPLMNLSKESERKKIPEVAEKFYTLVARYQGSITAEHNDGIIRTPFLGKMYSPEVLELFRKTKAIFDPENIFNPGKKVGGNLEYLEKHIDIG